MRDFGILFVFVVCASVRGRCGTNTNGIFNSEPCLKYSCQLDLVSAWLTLLACVFCHFPLAGSCCGLSAAQFRSLIA